MCLSRCVDVRRIEGQLLDEYDVCDQCVYSDCGITGQLYWWVYIILIVESATLWTAILGAICETIDI